MENIALANMVKAALRETEGAHVGLALRAGQAAEGQGVGLNVSGW